MLMDVPDFHKVFQSSYRILKPKGITIWVIMHPCFQSPHSETLEDGSRKITNYSEQWWKSNGNGTIRGTLGAYHRSLESYINSFISIGFRLKHIKADRLLGNLFYCTQWITQSVLERTFSIKRHDYIVKQEKSGSAWNWVLRQFLYIIYCPYNSINSITPWIM